MTWIVDCVAAFPLGAVLMSIILIGFGAMIGVMIGSYGQGWDQ